MTAGAALAQRLIDQGAIPQPKKAEKPMTTSMKLRTNGNYVAEARNEAGGASLYGAAGPGSNVESDWFNVPHTGVNVTERAATQEEIDNRAKVDEAAKAAAAAGTHTGDDRERLPPNPVRS